MFNEEFIRPFYLDTLNSQEIQEIQEYICNLKDIDYKHNQIKYEEFDAYRSCEIHYPSSSSIFFRIGKRIFKEMNQKYYKYDLRNVYEFQLIKYYEGGNYNWHCDYGISPRKGIVRKLSMTIQLSDSNDYEGGELQLIDYGNHTINVSTKLGTVAVFDAKLPHKVWPVVFGKRISLVGWASGPRLR